MPRPKSPGAFLASSASPANRLRSRASTRVRSCDRSRTGSSMSRRQTGEPLVVARNGGPCTALFGREVSLRELDSTPWHASHGGEEYRGKPAGKGKAREARLNGEASHQQRRDIAARDRHSSTAHGTGTSFGAPPLAPRRSFL